MSDLKRVLNCLSKKTLLELSQAFGFKGWVVLNKGEIVDRLAGDRSITIDELLSNLHIPQLKDICQDLWLPQVPPPGSDWQDSRCGEAAASAGNSETPEKGTTSECHPYEKK